MAVLQPRRAEHEDAEHGGRGEPRAEVPLTTVSARGLEGGRERCQFRQIRIELGDLADGGRRFAQLPVGDGGARRVDLSIDAPPPRALFEFRVAIHADQRTRGGRRRHVGRQRRGGWDPDAGGRDRFSTNDSIAQRDGSEETRIDVQRSGHFRQRPFAVTGFE